MSNSEEKTEETKSSDKEDFVQKFTKERSVWTENIVSIGKRFRDVEKLAEVQVDLYSQRQLLIEYQYKLIAIHIKLKRMFAIEWKTAYDNAGKNEDIRYSEKEKTKVSEFMTADLRYKVESVSSQIEFFRETMKTIDNMIFGVKHRIEIENFRIGMK